MKQWDNSYKHALEVKM